MQTGYRKPLEKLVLSDKSELLSIIIDFHTMAKSKAELDQLLQGLELFQFISMVRLHPVIWEPYFLFRDSCNAPLTPGLLGINLVMHVGIASFVFNVCCFGMSCLLA